MCGKEIHDAGYERCLRPDDGERDGLALGYGQQSLKVADFYGDIADLVFLCGARVSRGYEDGLHQRRLGDFPGQRMLTASRTYDQDIHQACRK
jgi:hypothetical protein